MLRLVSLALGVLGLDLLLVVVTGSTSPLTPGVPVGGLGFVVRVCATALLAGLRFRWLLPHPRRVSGSVLVIGLLLAPTLCEFQLSGGRTGGDGIMYYVYVRSLLKDADIDFTNEYAHYGLLERADLSMPTSTGLRRSIFAIGPALVWAPFFGLGEAVARGQQLLGAEVDLSGYGPCHRNAVALGSLLYGFAALLLIHALLRRYFRAGPALGAVLLLWGTTFLYWYMVQQPLMSHAVSAFGAAFALWLWDRFRGTPTVPRLLALGLALGLAMCIRWQNGVLLVLPGLDLLTQWRLGWRRLLGLGLALGAGALVAASPQLFAWKALYGMWLLPYPPHGIGFVRLDHPFILETLFSSRHGLLSWTPVFWAGFLGFLPLLARRPQIAWPLAIPLCLMTYVNLCSGDWWAGGSFSNRRFDSLLPILAFGFAASLDVLQRAFLRNRGLVLATLAIPLVLWNALLMEQVRRGLVPRDDTVAGPRLFGQAARLFADALGSPTTWPASWLFALRQGRPPGQYDLLVGRYLFYRQNNLGGHVEVGAPGDDAMLGEGWGPIETKDGRGVRRVLGQARLFAPLDVAEDLELRVRDTAASAAEVRVSVNGKLAGRFLAEPGFAEQRLRVDAGFWQRELNAVVLDAGAGEVWVDAVVFAPAGGRR